LPTFVCSVAALTLLSTALSAQPAPGRRGGLYGDYLIQSEVEGRQFSSILSFSRDPNGARTGQWITFMGLSDLQDLQLEDGKLTFTVTRPGRDGQSTTSKFAGTMAEGKLTGSITSDRGEMKVAGARIERMPRAAGSWAAKTKMGEREYTSTIDIKPAGEGKLAVDWKSERLERTVSDVTYERGQLAFKVKSKMEDREWDATFQGALEEDKLTGTMKSERGEASVEATRIGAAAIGTWNLEIASERGARKQRLRVEPDLSAWFGSTRVEKVTVDGDKLSFKISLEFGDQRFEIGFAGSVKDNALTGELTSTRGTQKVTGTKAPRMERRRTTI
jgi:hypothetical protein